MINQVTPNIANSKNVFAPLQSNGATYAITKPLTSEQEKAVEKEKESKSNALGAWIASTALIAGLVVFGLMKGLPKSWLKKMDGWFKQIEAKAAKLKENKQLSNLQKFYLSTLEKTKNLAPKAKGIFNFGTVKDAATKEAMNKTPFTKKISDSLTHFFEKISVRTSRRAYVKTLGRLDDYTGNVTDLSTKLSPEKARRVNEILDNINRISDSTFKSTSRNQRLRETKESLDGIHTKVKDKLLNIKSTITDKDTYTAFVAEDLAANAKNNLNAKLASPKKSIDDAIEELNNIFKESGNLSEKELAKLQKQSNRLQKSVNNAINTEGDLLFDKIRDLEIGSAPTDILGIVTSLGVIGWGLTKAENKDERISVLLKSGIPVVGAMIISLICTVGLVSGGASLAIGLGSGLVINKIGEYIDKRRKNIKQETIDFKSDIKTNIKNIVLPEAIIPKSLSAPEQLKLVQNKSSL